MSVQEPTRDKSLLELEKLDIEKQKLNEELRQLKVPLYKKPAYLGVFLPVCATLVVAILNFKRINDETLAKDLAQVKMEKEQIVQEKLSLGNQLLLLEKNDLNRQKENTELQIASFSEKIKSYSKEINTFRDSVARLTKLLDEERARLAKLDVDLGKRTGEIDELKAIIDKDSTSLTRLNEQIRVKQGEYKMVESKVRNLSLQSQLLFKVSKDLKGALIKFYTDWKVDKKKGDNESLRQTLISVRQELRTLYGQLDSKGDFADDFENMDRSIAALINDKKAFMKTNVLKNIDYVTTIDQRSNTLIEKLLRSV